MFVKYEKSLKIILKAYYKTNFRTFVSLDFDIPRTELDYLNARGLLKITPYTNGDKNCRIEIPDKALIYFDEKKDKLFRFWVPISISFVALIVSIISITLSLVQ